MGKFLKHVVNWKKACTKGHILYDSNLYKIYRIGKHIERDHRIASGAERRGLGNDCLLGFLLR